MSYRIAWNSNGRERVSPNDAHVIIAALEEGFGEVELSGGRVAYLDDDNEHLWIKHPDSVNHSLIGALLYEPEPDETLDGAS